MSVTVTGLAVDLIRQQQTRA